MSANIPEILVAQGPLKGRRFTVEATGLRLGRSSTCEISIPDPSLSRNHCLFEVRDGQLWVTDLASANGTLVNGEPLGADSKTLQPGDRVAAGETVLAFVEPGEDLPPEQQTAPQIDLGFRKQEESAGGKAAPMRLVLWIVAAVAVAGAAALIIATPTEPSDAPAPTELPDAAPVLQGFTFEKVEATADGIYRYALAYGADGTLAVEIDDVPKENRHVRKTTKLSSNAVERLTAILSAPELFKLSPEYAGVPLVAGTLKSFSLTVVRGDKVFSTTIENAPEPGEFRTVREQLETFSKNELGIWAIQFSAEKLVEMSAELRREGDAKWEERDVQYGNIAAALAAYNEAVFYLDTVNPKPETYGELVNRQKEVEAELDKRYRDQRFRADRAINLADWRTAEQELRVLCQMVPDAKDPRHAEAAGKLLDVENRMKKGLK